MTWICLDRRLLMLLNVSLKDRSYRIFIDRGLLSKAGNLFDFNRKCLIVTDDGVPSQYAKAVAAQCSSPYIVTIPQGETSKSLETFRTLLEKLLDHGFNRHDCVVAVGGGVVGDLAGFTASAYMRGIDFYNIPTTVLSQVDSSVGGKTGLNLNGIKNVVGAFYQPKGVLIDPDVLKTLPKRHVNNGLVEALKMALTSDAELFELFEKGRIYDTLDEIICRSIMIKKNVVELDEKETGLRRILNFGHTIGHAIESEKLQSGLYHGECVALGMLPMITDQELRRRVEKILYGMGLQTSLQFDIEKAMEALTHDKKAVKDDIRVTMVNAPGHYYETKLTVEAFRDLFAGIRKE